MAQQQNDLFGDPIPAPPDRAAHPEGIAGESPGTVLSADAAPARRRRASGPTGAPIAPITPDAELLALAAQLPSALYLGGSSWSYPGWDGLVWKGDYHETRLAKEGLAAYARHPLLRTVSIDRSFYRPLTASQYTRYAEQVPEDFRFMVKCPSVVTDALVRSEDGRGREPNPVFLSPQLAISEFVEPALQGLGTRLGALVFQISPLPLPLLDRMDEVLARLHTLLQALPDLREQAPDAVVALEVRDPHWLSPAFAQVLREGGATYCLGLHAKMPPLEQQLPLLRALWPGPLVCRWNLHPINGPYGYEDAERRYQPFHRLVDPDLPTREGLARVIAGVTGAGQKAYVAISNHAEGCAPLTIRAVAQGVAQAGAQAGVQAGRQARAAAALRRG